MTHGDLVGLIDYHYWARDRMIAAVAAVRPDDYTRPIEGSFGSIRDTVVHVYSAEWVWHSRWTGVSPTAAIPFERYPDVASVTEAWATLEQQVRAFVDRRSDDQTSRAIDYKLLNGTPGRATFEQMLQHLVNHASYHRGQVTTLLRQAGAAPPASTDLITFLRERSSLLA
jgi:uncharacterized damage-inducible protein DinB